MTRQFTRRDFLRRSGSAAGVAMLGLTLSQFLTACEEAGKAQRAGKGFKVLSAEEATELEAFASVILPTTDSPGAREAGAIYFFDNVLSGSRSDLLPLIRMSLADLESRVRAAGVGAKRFSELNEPLQIRLLTDIEDSEFFQTARLFTMAGVLANPSYGGNRDRIGWELIGFEDHFAHQAPYGHYDANYGEQNDG